MNEIPVSPTPEFGMPEVPPKKSKRVWIIITAAAVLFVFIGYVVYWDANLSPRAKMEKQEEQNIQVYQQFINDFETAMRADTYGGATPQETLDMFIAALKAGDIDLASKYFALETNENSPNYLTRREAEGALKQIQKEQRIVGLVSELEKAEPTRDQSKVVPSVYWFSVYSTSGEELYNFEFDLNKYSKVWKIENM